mmetsp:Transcript_14924/g.37123  ORF Transcript_14924/g.37123 Transcript_14924/m.37123 type:complete len:388 (+) Transcript_14924:122-1285(+)
MVRVVVLIQTGKRHARDETTPEVGAQEVGGCRVDHQHDHHHQEKHLILRADLGARGLRRHTGQDELVDELGPELHSAIHGDQHEGDSDDGRNDHGEEVKLPPEAEQYVEQDEGEDVVHEGGCDDGLPEILLEHLGLTEQAERDADTRRRKGCADGDAVGHQRAAVDHRQDGAGDQRRDRAEDCHDTGLRTDLPRLLKVEMHAALENHQGDPCVADEGEEVRGQLAFVGDLGLAALDEALLVGRVRPAAAEPPVHVCAVVCDHGGLLVMGGSAVGVMVGLGVVEVLVLGAIIHVGNHAQPLSKGLPLFDELREVVRRGAVDVPRVLARHVLLGHEAEHGRAEDDACGDLQDDRRDACQPRDLGGDPSHAQETCDGEHRYETAGSSHGV